MKDSDDQLTGVSCDSFQGVIVTLAIPLWEV